MLNDLRRTGHGTQGTNPLYNLVDGKWDRDLVDYGQAYISPHIVQHLRRTGLIASRYRQS